MPPSALAMKTGFFVDAIDEQPDVELPLDGQPLFDQHAADALTGRAGLVRDQLHAEDGLGVGLDRLEALGDLDAAALAAAAGVDLRLDDRHRTAEPLGDLDGLLRREGDLAARHRHAELREDGLGLIFVNLHVGLRP